MRHRPLRWARTGLAACMALLLCAFGCGGSGAAAPPAPKVPAFDAARAFADLETQVAFGPRAPGTPERAAALKWLRTTLAEGAVQFKDQAFTFEPTDGSEPIQGNNLLARFSAQLGAGGEPLMISAHWDCRPVADQDAIPANRTKAVPGANDSASGVAVILELARIFRAQPPPRPVILALWDLEDSGQLPHTNGTPYMGFCQGSRYFAQNHEGWRPAEAINIDMIGDANLDIYREGYSELSHPELLDRIFAAAARLGHRQFVNEPGTLITDDHKPLIDVGIPAVDLIDLDYPGPRSNRYWHTLMDTPEHCSPESLRAVGETLLAVIYG